MVWLDNLDPKQRQSKVIWLDKSDERGVKIMYYMIFGVGEMDLSVYDIFLGSLHFLNI